MESRGRHNSVMAREKSNDKVVNLMRIAIRSLENCRINDVESAFEEEQLLPEGVVLHREQILINKRTATIRRCYLENQPNYRTGWVVDWDLKVCMLCFERFGWLSGRPKHHCRACGSLVCHKCSPYATIVPGIKEGKQGSRVCKACFGLKPALFGNTPVAASRDSFSTLMSGNSSGGQAAHQQRHSFYSPSQVKNMPVHVESNEETRGDISPMSASPVPTSSDSVTRINGLVDHIDATTPTTRSTIDVSNIRGSVRRPSARRNSSIVSQGSAAFATNGSRSKSVHAGVDDITAEEIRLANEQLATYEREQEPVYQAAYLKMREFIPLNIHRTNINAMVEKMDMPEPLAKHVWNKKALWLITMHKDDIYKVHLADFRSKYVPEGLDLEELRAIWYNLPRWDENSENSQERGKAEWKAALKSKLDNNAFKAAYGCLAGHLVRNPIYEEYELMHLFDPEEPVRTRFERSASMKKESRELYEDDGASISNHLISSAKLGDSTPSSSTKEKAQAYMRSCGNDGTTIPESGGVDENGAHDNAEITGYPDDDEDLFADRRIADNAETDSYDGIDDGISDVEEVNDVSEDSDEINDDDLEDVDNQEEEGIDDDYEESGEEIDRRMLSVDNAVPFQNEGHQNSLESNQQQQPFQHQSYQGVHAMDDNLFPYSSAMQNRRFIDPTGSSFRYREPTGAGPTYSPYGSPFQSQSGSFYGNQHYGTGPPGVRGGGMDMYHLQRSGSGYVPSMYATGAGNLASHPHTLSPYSSFAYTANAAAPPATLATGSLSHHASFSNHYTPMLRHYPNVASGSLTPPTGGSINSNLYFQEGIPQSSMPAPAYHQQRSEDETFEQTNMLRTSDALVGNDRATNAKVSIQQAHFEQQKRERQYQGESPSNEAQNPLAARRRSSGRLSFNNGDPGVSAGSSIPSPTGAAGGSGTRDADAEDSSIISAANSSLSSAAIMHDPTYQQQSHAVGRLQQHSSASSTRDSAPKGSSKKKFLQPPPPTAVADTNPVGSGSMALSGRGKGRKSDTAWTGEMEQQSQTQSSISAATTTAADSSSTNNRSTNADSQSPARPGALLRASTNKSASFDELDDPVDVLITFMKQGNARSAGRILNKYNSQENDSKLLDEITASRLMFQCFRNLGGSSGKCEMRTARLKQPMETLKLFVDALSVDINVIDHESCNGKTLLHYAVECKQEELGRYLVSHGADIFIDDLSGDSPMSLSLTGKLEWLVSEFKSSGRLNALLHAGQTDLVFKFTTFLIFAGYSEEASAVLDEGILQVSEEEATELLQSCRGNFENMKNPIETFELLESLGARLSEIAH